MRSYVLRLDGARAATDANRAESACPPTATEIGVARFVDLLLAVQTLLYRITREVADRAGLGRTIRALERTSAARVAWSGDPGMVLLRIGDPSTLDIDPFAESVDAAIGQILTGMAAGRRPEVATNPIAAAVDDVIRALQWVADEVRVEVPNQTEVLLRPAELTREPWQPARTEPASRVELAGRLEMVDLHSGRFRVRDALGEAYDLPEVIDATPTARLVGRPVIVRGILLPGAGTQHNRVENASVEPAEAGLGPPGPAASNARDHTHGGPGPSDFGQCDFGQSASGQNASGQNASGQSDSGQGGADPLDLSDDGWRRFLAAHREDL
ncbi:MAG: hypothetical protein V9G19_19730 [Tetrasphaera sp.]